MAETQPETVIDLRQNDAPDNSSPNPFAVRGFQKGHDPRRNAHGRPKKGASLPEKLKHRVEKDADKVIEAVMKRLTRDDAVGNRAFSDVRDTVYGLPKQTLVLEQGESPLAELLRRRQERLSPTGERRLTVDGESRVINDNANDIT